MQRKVLTLPNSLTDWYVPRNVGVPQRFLESNPDEQQLQRYVAKLHQLGIPTFLLEERQPHVSKFFVPLEAYVRERRIPTNESARGAFWEALKDGLVLQFGGRLRC